MNHIDKLEWDTNFFGYNIGKLLVSEDLDIEKFKTEASPYKLVYVFSKKMLHDANIDLVDKKVVFMRQVFPKNSKEKFNNRIEFFDENKYDRNQLVDLALQSGVYSRFKLDKNFKNQEYTKLYSEWVNKCMDRKSEFDILVALNDNNIIGFTTLSKVNEELADIGLVAVDQNFRGQGVGTELLSETIMRASQKSFGNIQVVTQMDNLPAVNLYEKLNFGIQEISFIFHYWNL
jgi:dTDP-4-amino-4,6-dideoxy-D-galactose acyltransferase